MKNSGESEQNQEEIGIIKIGLKLKILGCNVQFYLFIFKA